MGQKRKPTKPVKAWAYVHRVTGEIDVWQGWSRDELRADPSIYRLPKDWRVARVEIKEIGR